MAVCSPAALIAIVINVLTLLAVFVGVSFAFIVSRRRERGLLAGLVAPKQLTPKQILGIDDRTILGDLSTYQGTCLRTVAIRLSNTNVHHCCPIVTCPSPYPRAFLTIVRCDG